MSLSFCRSRRVTWPLLAGAVLTIGCRTQPPPVAPTPAPPVDVRAQALGRDPEPADEALADQIRQLQDRFACNGVSGCPAQGRLTALGWNARPALESVFSRAPQQASYRARTVAIIAALKDPQAEAFLVRVLDDRDPEVRAHAIDGLGRLGAVQHRQRIWELSSAADTLWMSPARLAALHVLARWGDRQAGAQFVQTLQTLSTQQMGTAALVVAANLCKDPSGPSCSAALPMMAIHPNFHVRRATLQAMTAPLRPAYARALVYLTGDQAHSIRDDAESALIALSGRSDMRGRAAWQAWCDADGCKAALPLAKASTETGER